MTNFSIYRKTTGTLKIPRISSGSMDIVRKTTGNFKIPMPQLLPAPSFVSAEVGLIDAYTIDVLLSLALNESKIPDSADLIPAFSGGATQIYDRTITGLHLYAKTGIDSWYSPSIDEVTLMHTNLHLFGVGGFRSSYYVSSSEYNATNYILLNFITGTQSQQVKISDYYSRPIRSFTSLKNYALRDTSPYGGWIFYKNGNDYLECAPTDSAGTSAFSNITDVLIGTTSTAIGTGQANTTAIIGQSGHTTSAAKLCNDLVIGRAITAGETGTFQYIPNALLAKKLTGLNGGLVAAFTENVTNNVSGAPDIPTGLIAVWVDDFARLTVDAIPADVEIEWYESEDGVTYNLVTTTAVGVLTYDNYTWQNATMRFKARAKRGDYYSDYTDVVTLVTPLVWKTNQSILTNVVINSLNVLAGKTVNINWGDNTNNNYTGTNSNITKSYSSTQNPYFIQVSGDINEVTSMSHFAQAKSYGDLTKWVRPLKWATVRLETCAFTGNFFSRADCMDNLPGTAFIYYIYNNRFSGEPGFTTFSSKINNLFILGNQFSGDWSDILIPVNESTSAQYRLEDNDLTDFPRGEYKKIIVFNAARNNVVTAKLDIWLNYLNTYFSSNAPLGDCTYTLNGAGMGYPTGGASNTDILAIQAAYTAAGKVATFVINT